MPCQVEGRGSQVLDGIQTLVCGEQVLAEAPARTPPHGRQEEGQAPHRLVGVDLHSLEHSMWLAYASCLQNDPWSAVLAYLSSGARHRLNLSR